LKAAQNSGPEIIAGEQPRKRRGDLARRRKNEGTPDRDRGEAPQEKGGADSKQAEAEFSRETVPSLSPAFFGRRAA
jgi:hypothetical protein